jgi:hypothetical protein
VGLLSALRIGGAILLLPTCACADTLTITSNPSGATVEINGMVAGTTPYEQSVPGGYFHRTITAPGSRLDHRMVARIRLDGYATKELELTEGPKNWLDLRSHSHGEYWLRKQRHFHVDLDPIAQTFTGTVSTQLANGAAINYAARTSGSSIVTEAERGLPIEEVVARTKPSVVFLKVLAKSGSGFFVSDTGVIATNAHLAREEETLLTLLSGGQQLEARVVYVDTDRDIALAKMEGSGFSPLTLADVSTVQQGQSVLAIGNPGDAMLFSVTKGIVSGVGRFSSAGPGTWIQRMRRSLLATAGDPS